MAAARLTVSARCSLASRMLAPPGEKNPTDRSAGPDGPPSRAGTGRRSLAAISRSTEVKKPRPSVPGPVSASIACSGCGMSPTTLPASLRTPAISPTDPFGLPPAYRATTWPAAVSRASVAGSATYAPSPLFSTTLIS